MIYLAGMFDAEGCCSLGVKGNQIIEITMSNEEIPNIFKSTFGGYISDYKREKRKKVFCWRCSADNIPYFISQISPHSILKKSQLILFNSYLDQTRENRRNTRSEYVSKIAECKRPNICNIESLRIPTTIKPTDEFFQWLAGFFDGDGNFCCFEYTDTRFNLNRPHFSCTVSCFNVMSNVIKYIIERQEGSISVLKQNKNPVWKWVCAKHNFLSFCESLLPHLKIKKECCKLTIEFRNLMETKIRSKHGKGQGFGKGGWDNPAIQYSHEEINKMREIIQQIRHHNSL